MTSIPRNTINTWAGAFMTRPTRTRLLA